MTLVREHGAEAARILGGLAGAASEALVGLFIFFYAVYVFLIDGPTYYRWLEEHAPIEATPTRRLVGAFHETGRGLFIGVALTGLAQGVVATIAYLALGVPRALVLGLLTCLTSIIPSVGTALVWVPVAIGLALAGKVVPAIIMGVVGVVVIASVDNILRPMFARFGKLELSTFVLLTSISEGSPWWEPGASSWGRSRCVWPKKRSRSRARSQKREGAPTRRRGLSSPFLRVPWSRPEPHRALRWGPPTM